MGSANYVNWQKTNNALTPLANVVDIFFPACYTFNTDTLAWKNFVTAVVSEAKKYNTGKHIYAYIWPQFHEGTGLDLQFVPAAVWKFELETLYPLTDGVVIWSGNKAAGGSTISWDENSPWWQETQAFIARHQIH